MTKSIFIAMLISATVIKVYSQEETDSIPIPENRIIETMPEFDGGEVAFQKFVKENLVYPAKARRRGEQGKVVVQILVDAQGNIVGSKIIEGQELEYGLPEEALRLIQIMPKWKPATLQRSPGKIELIPGSTLVTFTFR